MQRDFQDLARKDTGWLARKDFSSPLYRTVVPLEGTRPERLLLLVRDFTRMCSLMPPQAVRAPTPARRMKRQMLLKRCRISIVCQEGLQASTCIAGESLVPYLPTGWSGPLTEENRHCYNCLPFFGDNGVSGVRLESGRTMTSSGGSQ